MKKWQALFLGACVSSALLISPVAAADHTDTTGVSDPSDWEISVKPKPTPAEIEAARWTLLHKEKDIHYNYEEKSLVRDAKDPNIIRVNVRAIYADPVSVALMDKKYQDKLNTFDSVSYSENLMAINLKDHTWTQTSAKIFSFAGKLVDTPVFTETYAPIEKDTFQESLFYIAQLFADTGRTGIATEAR